MRFVFIALLLAGCDSGIGGTVTLATGVKVADVRACDDPKDYEREGIAISEGPGGYDVRVSSFRNEYALPDAYLSEVGSNEMATLVLSSPTHKGLFSNKTECFGVMRVAVTGRLEPGQTLYVTYNGRVVGEGGVP